jgi:hypothetical protein
MAQAVVDLPDQPDPAPQSIEQTDELLSQMVGDDIDRLIADNQIEASAITTELQGETSDEAPAPPSLEESLTAQLDDLFNELQNPPPEEAPAEAPASEVQEVTPVPEAPAPVEAAPAEAAPTATEPAPPVAAKEAEAPQGEERAALLQAAGFQAPADFPPADAANQKPTEPAAPISASPDPVHDTAPAGSERTALLAAAGFDTNPNAPALEIGPNPEPTVGHLVLDDNAPLPIYLKPLEWINAPLQSAPMVFRQLLGRAAVVTLINALAVLTYVLIFRKH